MKEVDQRTLEEKLASLRNRINIADATILGDLSKRLEIITEIGELKKDNNLPVEDLARFDDMMKYRRSLGESLGLPESLVDKLFALIHEYSKNLQKEIQKNK